jgi:hypothetical protein
MAIHGFMIKVIPVPVDASPGVRLPAICSPALAGCRNQHDQLIRHRDWLPATLIPAIAGVDRPV